MFLQPASQLALRNLREVSASLIAEVLTARIQSNFRCAQTKDRPWTLYPQTVTGRKQADVTTDLPRTNRRPVGLRVFKHHSTALGWKYDRAN